MEMKVNSTRRIIMIALSLILMTSFVTPANAEGSNVQVWLTTADQQQLLQQQNDLEFSLNNSIEGVTIQVDESKEFQVMDGFGAAMSGSSAWLFNQKLNDWERNAIYNDLFSNEGIGLSFVRHTVGASDFSLESYSYDDMAAGLTDPTLANFSIDKDKQNVIPMLKEALTINPNLKIMGTPWSAPGWMKDNGSLNGGKLLPQYYNVYAQYLAKYINSYQNEGLPIYAMTIQNEPHHETAGYPSMKMEASEQIDFVKNHLGPTFNSQAIDTKILSWDHNWNEYDYPIEVMNDEEAKSYLAGSAFHCYGGTPEQQSLVQNAHPDKGIWFTECSGGEWSTDFGDNLAWNMSNVVIGSTRNWAKSVLLWNLALDENFGPINGGCTDCRGVVTINQQTGDVYKNVEYYVLGHISKFVKPGAKRIDTNYDNDIQNVAFKNTDGSKTLLVLNNANTHQTFTVKEGDESFKYTLPAGAVATFVWNSSNNSNLIVNGDFELGALNNWQSWTPEGQDPVHKVDTDYPLSGAYKMTHWQSFPYQQTTYQHISVANGVYKASVWVRSSGGQNTLRLEASNYGGSTLYANIGSTSIGDWTKFEIDNIDVTSGTVTIGVYSDGNEHNWAAFDNIQLIKK
ncbi:glycoside hydrolase family 30 beta sandwich domain-containing protein [Cytobacillus sp. IB215665]|uniref:glycoside hydrolase family 30 beta sandwich domain-containing protein n=1 Tax=Cytobacillus sp. IB215665 TaxID=3097357 RepID=UPI002A14C645|nr:glycoside hydrolase family 30 beta sandwich domain-containing protein [Cytobacillus sp. IB215665]MDX8366405.1 glycoside hydrolase family 30 beta sandwich domain-containing protein [Cytobacillus sp. IB215665]